MYLLEWDFLFVVFDAEERVDDGREIDQTFSTMYMDVLILRSVVVHGVQVVEISSFPYEYQKKALLSNEDQYVFDDTRRITKGRDLRKIYVNCLPLTSRRLCIFPKENKIRAWVIFYI